jgi:hypothetical protein
MEDDETILNNSLKAEARRIAVHEAGHAVVAHWLGGDVLLVEMDSYTLDGGRVVRLNEFTTIEDLAVCVAGCRAEHLLQEFTRRKTKKGDFTRMRELLSRLPEADRRTARAEGYRLANEKLKEHEDDVRKVADRLMRKWSVKDRIIRIERDELIALFGG